VFVFFLPGLTNACFAVWTLAVRSESSSTPISYPRMDAFIAYASVVLALMLFIVSVLTHQLMATEDH
jgi:succinate dehydrogenase/fumarate reductase cytochrome b subunit